MRSYMAGKEDVGSYRVTFDYSLKNFAAGDPVAMAAKSGSVFIPERSVIRLNCLGQIIDVEYPGGRVTFAGSDLFPVWSWRLVILNHLARADGAPLACALISYRELENGQVFYAAFQRESIRPLAERLAEEPAGRIKEACLRLGARLEEKADVCAVFDFLPRFPVTVKIWLKDEEVGGSANILFDASANHYLHTEDIAVAGNLVSYFLIKECESLKTGI